ncbi:MAG: sigma-70 family RNA polymerase sigma factor [Myxococcota bacterium]
MVKTPSHIRVVEPLPGPLTTDALFRRYGAYVATIGMRILGRRDRAEDLVQEVFFEAHKRLHTIRDPNAAKSWLARIAVRKAYRQLKRRRFREWIGFEDLGADAEPSVPAGMDDRVLFTQLYDHLDRLPAQERIPWVLRNLDQMPLADVAEACDCSLATVKRRIAAAQASLDELSGE